MSQENIPTIWAIVPAAGSGRRMQSQTPKQYLKVLGKSVLEHTLEKLLSIECLEGIVLALHPSDECWQDTAFAKHAKIHRVCGGNERRDSVANALQYCQQKDANKISWALVHDAARPCVSTAKIRELVACGLDSSGASGSAGAILAVPASDTIKRVVDGKIVSTEDRSQLWLAQTPQFFPAGLLLHALLECQRRNIPITDESSAMEAVGYAVRVVQDRRDNIKVTVPEDLLWAQTILRGQFDAAENSQGSV